MNQQSSLNKNRSLNKSRSLNIRRAKNKSIEVNQYSLKLIQPSGEGKNGNLSLIQDWKSQQESFLWIDCTLSNENELRELLQDFQVHELAIKDLLRKKHPPKIERFDEYTLILYRGLHDIDDSFSFKYQDIGFLIGERLLITTRRNTSYSIDHFIKNYALTEHSPLALATHIMLYSAGLYLSKVQDFESELNDIEDTALEGSAERVMLQLSSSRSTLLRLKRIFNYHKKISAELVLAYNNETAQKPPCDIHLLNDLNDRFNRIHSLVSMLYEICGDILNAYLSIASHMLNNKMGVLTMITAIFVPLSFLAGIYGMNFEYIPELKHHSGYFVLLGFMAILSSVMLAGFKIKKWF